eukprot:CAMPEP_0168605084 /NCGR_PEP_ID=MMETSP0420-20121227/15722_1 /TAXON_ID=498008 /ORGANISM="Pessonella sp." /LENGTH=162 /DNA_ID=CAMNT_0008644405 /DNA_START=164 /DNA_END=652 /DNA_ORIENTATION=+
MVVGVVLDRHGEAYKVDVGSAATASLPILGFEGASKKNRPMLKRGDLVYARVVIANKDMDPELLCYSSRNKSDGFGPLTDGYMLKCSIRLANLLLQKECYIFQRLSGHFPFDVAIGHNGRVHIKTTKISQTIIVAQAILNSEYLSKTQQDKMVAMLTASIEE